jgi:hypothetical protein
MKKYKLIYDQFKGDWIAKVINNQDVGDLQDITNELNDLILQREEWRKCAEKLAAIIGPPNKATWSTEEEISLAWGVFQKLKEQL